MKKKNKILITTGTLLAAGGILVGAYALNGSGILERTNDVTPPYGRISIKGATETNNINYVDRTQVEVEIYAKDDTCSGDEIKYYISTSPISNAEKLEDSKWKSYYEGAVEKVDLPSLSSTNTIYAAFKDKWGNTSTIYTGENTEYTITYDANGGTNAPLAQTVQYGMPFYIASGKPSYEGKYFVGWSEIKGTTMADYEGVEIYTQNEKIGANSLSTDKNITLYAVWTDEIEELPLLSERVKVGDYVNYPVYYENVISYNGSDYILNLTGWRVLSIEEDGTVNLISAGVPLTYYHYNNSETSIKNLVFDFLDIPFGTTENYTFRQTGFNPYESLKETFNNKYTATYESDTTEKYTCSYEDGTVVEYSTTKKAGDLKVRSITKQDVDKVYDPTGKTTTKNGTSVTNAKFEKMLALPATDRSGQYCDYLLASAYGGYSLRYVYGYGNVYYIDSAERGVRPVVSLKPTVRTTGTDIIGAWNIEL